MTRSCLAAKAASYLHNSRARSPARNAFQLERLINWSVARYLDPPGSVAIHPGRPHRPTRVWRVGRFSFKVALVGRACGAGASPTVSLQAAGLVVPYRAHPVLACPLAVQLSDAQTRVSFKIR